MQNIDLICIGKLNMPFYASGVAEYQKRLAAFCNFRIVELPEAAIDERHASAAQVEKALEKDGIYVSVGLCWKEKVSIIDPFVRSAEKQMYAAKKKFYEQEAHDRRRFRK